jgi:hypothetical protein
MPVTVKLAAPLRFARPPWETTQRPEPSVTQLPVPEASPLQTPETVAFATASPRSSATLTDTSACQRFPFAFDVSDPSRSEIDSVVATATSSIVTYAAEAADASETVARREIRNATTPWKEDRRHLNRPDWVGIPTIHPHGAPSHPDAMPAEQSDPRRLARGFIQTVLIPLYFAAERRTAMR